MISLYIFWGILTILASSFWFLVRESWIQGTEDKNKCFWVCWIGTIFIQFLLLIMVEIEHTRNSTSLAEKVKITINSNIPRDSLEIIVNSKYETHSTDLP